MVGGRRRITIFDGVIAKMARGGSSLVVIQRHRQSYGLTRVVVSCAVAATLLFATADVHAAQLTVKVQGATDARGRVAVALFAQPDGFPKEDGKAQQRQFVPIDAQSNSARAVFTDLAPGVYAVSVFHDNDSSGKLETSFFGIPLKGYGFSQNVNPSMRAARFDEAQFKISEPGASITIRLVYR